MHPHISQRHIPQRLWNLQSNQSVVWGMKKWRMQKLFVGLFCFALLAGACNSKGDSSVGPNTGAGPEPTNSTVLNISGNPTNNAPPDGATERNIELASALRSFADCSALLNYLRTETTERVGPYGLQDRHQPYFGFDVAQDDAAVELVTESAPVQADVGTSSESSAASSDGTFSTTNVQVAGVDEPDLIKTDGNRILAIANQHLHYVDLSGTEPAYRGSVKLNEKGWGGQEILVYGDWALVMSKAPPISGSTEDFWFTGNESALVQQVDLSNPAAMQVVATLNVEGQYLSARSVGNIAWLLITSNPLQFEFVYPSGPSAEEVAERVNKEIAASADLDAWLPAYSLERSGQSTTGLIPECTNLYTPPDFSGFNVLTVLAVDMSQPLALGDSASVLADGHTLYSSGEAIYLAESKPIRSDENDRLAQTTRSISQWRSDWLTTVHKFSVSTSRGVSYEATGEVYGHLLNQFSMDEHNGYFRIATTIGEPWDTRNSQSQVVVLAQQGRQLAIVGSVGGLGRGERIYSVRYMGDVGYVVTFRQVDPLYVLDLSDPTNPTVSGELKIPGFSNYLHPLSDGLLAGIGQQADNQGRTLGTKVSLFDVSDPANPTELDFLVFPNSHSEVEWDHRAFLYWPETEMLAIPLNEYERFFPEPIIDSAPADSTDSTDTADNISIPTTQDAFSGAVVLRANRNGVEEIGRITHLTNMARFADYNPPIQRLVVADEALWSLTNHAIQANHLESLEYETHFVFPSS